MVTTRTKTKGEHDLGSLEREPSRSTSRTLRRMENWNRLQQYQNFEFKVSKTCPEDQCKPQQSWSFKLKVLKTCPYNLNKL